MTKLNEEEYWRLRRRLEIDLLRIDEELIELPMLTMDACEQACIAAASRDAMKAKREVIAAHISHEICSASERKPAEERIKAEILCDPRYQEADTKFLDAELDANLWKSLAEAYRTKQSTLRATCELIVAGYLTPASVVRAERERRRPQKTS